MKKLLLLFLATAPLAQAADDARRMEDFQDELRNTGRGRQERPRDEQPRVNIGGIREPRLRDAFDIGYAAGEAAEKAGKGNGFFNRVGKSLVRGAESALAQGTADILYGTGKIAFTSAYQTYKTSGTPLSPEEQALEKEINDWTKKSEDVVLRVAVLKAQKQFIDLTALEAKLENEIRESDKFHQEIMRKKAELAKKKAEEEAKAEALKVAMLEQQGSIPSAPAA